MQAFGHASWPRTSRRPMAIITIQAICLANDTGFRYASGRDGHLTAAARPSAGRAPE